MRKPLPEPSPLRIQSIDLLVACAREGWSAEEIAAATRIRIDDVQMWLAIYRETARVAMPEEVPAGFSPIEKVRKIAASEVVPASVQLAACKLLLQEHDTKMRVDWAAVRVEDIPPEQRPYLAGMLVEHLNTDGVDREFIDAGQPERDLFMVVGVLVDDPMTAIELLNTHRQHLEDLRAEAKRRKVKRRLEAPTVRFAATFKPGKNMAEVEVEAREEDAEE